MKVDLHSHSYYSDGVYSPSEVLEYAKQAKCDLFSLTDHDTTDGLSEAQERAEKLSIIFIARLLNTYSNCNQVITIQRLII